MMKHLRFLLKALFVLSIVLFGGINGFAQNRFEARINESAGDAEEQGTTGVNPGENYLISAINMVYDTLGVKYRGQQTIGLRFTDVDIPRDALILNAYIQFDSWIPSTDSTSLYIWTEDVENAPAILEVDYNISSRVKSAASVPWIDVPAWNNGGLHGPDQQTPELASIIQSIVDKTGWMTGNSLCFIIQGFGQRVATSWDNNPDLAPNLIVDFGAKISEAVCDSYTSPSGKIWTSSGSYFDTIPNSFGGDSIILVDLTVLESTTSAITATVCDSYTSPSGKTWTISGTYLDTIPNAASCDSVITVDLTVNASSASSITETVCESYLSPSGKTLTVSGIYMDTIPNLAGCDSVITIDLTVNNSSASTIAETVCDSYTSPSGKIWTTSGTYMDTIPNATGCDSVITIDLTVNTTYTGEIQDTICSGETYSFGGKEITETGQYTDSLTSISGCDSIVVLNLMVHSIDTSITVSGGDVLTANETDAQYQWMQNNNIIDGATAQSYTVTETGSYSVVITKNDCVDTSGVYNIQIVTGLSDVSFGSRISVYPNPTKGVFTLDMGTEYETLSLRLYNITGKLISIKEYKACREIKYQIDGARGVYFLHVSSGKGEKAHIKIMKE
jgi:hypothetical protein